MSRHPLLAPAGVVLAGLAAPSCGDPGGWQTTQSSRLVGPAALQVQLTARPTLVYHPDRAVTEVGLSYVVRDADQAPLGDAETVSEITIDDQPLDAESLWQDSAEMPPVRVLYSLVLDASYSLVAHGPAPMAAMLAAAQASVEEGRQRVAAGGRHSFAWRLAWFDDFVHLPMPEDSWRSEDIAAVPAPLARGLFTRMRSAVAYALEGARRRQAEDPAGRWQHVLALFSDGADNHSDAQLAPPAEPAGTLPGGLQYSRLAGPAIDEAALLQTVRAFDGLTLHTIGIGPPSAAHAGELQRLATAGRGTYQHGPDTENLPALFRRVAQEFTTVQTRAVVLPHGSGDYRLTLRVRAAEAARGAGAAAGDVTVRLHLGDPSARPLDDVGADGGARP